ncbi:hypothetical protein LCGC14_2592910 [marine sediment metagenome]|uniref:Uncharacterized protein n=1 Tax=marine sediment metagenome TaxID=412755 RepID=A0A0F9ABE6_9ZZZZ
MAELLEKRLQYLKARLEDLKKSHAKKDRALIVDIQIETIEQQIKKLSNMELQGETWH